MPESFIDKAIRKAMEEGEFSNLPGEGKPLNLKDDPNTPDHLQMAYKILKDNDLAPDWILQGHELEAKLEQWATRLKQAVRAYHAAQSDAAWKRTRGRLTEEAARLNKEILTYNLKVPAGAGAAPDQLEETDWPKHFSC